MIDNQFYILLSYFIDFNIVSNDFKFNNNNFDICLNYLNESKDDISDDLIYLFDMFDDCIYYADFSEKDNLVFVKFN